MASKEIGWKVVCSKHNNTKKKEQSRSKEGKQKRQTETPHVQLPVKERAGRRETGSDPRYPPGAAPKDWGDCQWRLTRSRQHWIGLSLQEAECLFRITHHYHK